MQGLKKKIILVHLFSFCTVKGFPQLVTRTVTNAHGNVMIHYKACFINGLLESLQNPTL